MLNLVYLPISWIRIALIQVALVILSFNPLYQSIATLVIQVVFVLYTLAYNPFKKPYRIVVYAN